MSQPKTFEQSHEHEHIHLPTAEKIPQVLGVSYFLTVNLENSWLYFWGILFYQKVLKLIPQKLKQLLKCSCHSQLMNYRDFLVWIIT